MGALPGKSQFEQTSVSAVGPAQKLCSLKQKEGKRLNYVFLFLVDSGRVFYNKGLIKAHNSNKLVGDDVLGEVLHGSPIFLASGNDLVCGELESISSSVAQLNSVTTCNA